MLFNIEIRRQHQPLACRMMPAPKGNPRSLQHARRNVVVRVRGCRTTKIQAHLYGMRTQQYGLFCDTLLVKKKANMLNVSIIYFS